MLDFTKRSIVFVALFKPKDRNICGVHQMLFETFSQIVSTDLDSFVTDSTVVIPETLKDNMKTMNGKCNTPASYLDKLLKYNYLLLNTQRIH